MIVFFLLQLIFSANKHKGHISFEKLNIKLSNKLLISVLINSKEEIILCGNL